jgi:hypothetical protein
LYPILHTWVGKVFLHARVVFFREKMIYGGSKGVLNLTKILTHTHTHTHTHTLFHFPLQAQAASKP